MRAKFKGQILKEHNINLWFMSALPRTSVLALRANASIESGDAIVCRADVDLSVTVATPKGLVTSVLRNAEAMGFLRSRRDGAWRQLTIEDMAGGSFTSVFHRGYMCVGLTRCMKARMVGSSVAYSPRPLSTCLKLLCSACTSSRRRKWTYRRSSNYGRCADIRPLVNG